MSGLS